MHGLLPVSLCSLILLSLHPAHASSVYRCVADNGHITFTRQGCPTSQTQQLQQTFNPTPGSGKAVPMAKPSPRKATKREAPQELTVVAEQDDGCGNRVTGNARRKAIISQQIRAGMTRADVESALGKPDSVTSSNGQTRFRYVGDKGRSRTVTFDEAGCVRGRK